MNAGDSLIFNISNINPKFKLKNTFEDLLNIFSP